MVTSRQVVSAQQRKKQFAVEQFGGKCQRCGYNKSIEALEFHHREETRKKFSPSYIIKRWSWNRVVRELRKCVLLCSNCHKELHASEKEEYFPEVPLLRVKCKFCKKIYYTVNHGSVYCSANCKHLDSRKVLERPTRDELDELLTEFSWRDIGRKFGVSDTAVRKWAKAYKLI